MSVANLLLMKLDDAVRVGDIDKACDFAKQVAQIYGSNKNTVGMTAIIMIVQSVERVVGK